jgi:homoserine dehydrogenase (EC 1.1.1.3)
MKNGKSVVTANKDMIAERGEELFETQRNCGVDFFFEESVGGAIPIVKALKESLAGDEIREIVAIINGTTNYILSKMSLCSADYEETLREAQQNGYAEADPTSDVEGYDAARKLAILTSIAFNFRITFKDVYIEGISKITKIDIRYAREFNGVIKLLAIGKTTERGIEVRVHPTIIPSSHPLAAVNDVFNAVFVRSNAAVSSCSTVEARVDFRRRVPWLETSSRRSTIFFTETEGESAAPATNENLCCPWKRS